jgi:hypothetical protein
MTNPILAIDLGRYKSVVCIDQRASREHTFHTINTTPAELTKLLTRHPKRSSSLRPAPTTACGETAYTQTPNAQTHRFFNSRRHSPFLVLCASCLWQVQSVRNCVRQNVVAHTTAA